MSASQNKKKTLSLGLALIPVISMLLLLIIGYGIMGLRIEPLLLCSAAVAAGIAWWQGYCWEDIINSVVDKLAKAMPVIMILICVGGLIGTWMFSGTIPYMVYWGLKLISPEYILIAAFFLTSVVSVCTGTSWGSAGTVGVALMGVAAGDRTVGRNSQEACHPINVKRLRTCLIPRRHHAGTEHQTGTGRFH